MNLLSCPFLYYAHNVVTPLSLSGVVHIGAGMDGISDLVDVLHVAQVDVSVWYRILLCVPAEKGEHRRAFGVGQGRYGSEL